jgi:acyl-CoA thioester hydrolase
VPSYLVDLPDKFVFSTTLPVVYSDLNPGRHLAAEKALPLVLETQLRFCRHLGYQDPPDKEFGV